MGAGIKAEARTEAWSEAWTVAWVGPEKDDVSLNLDNLVTFSCIILLIY